MGLKERAQEGQGLNPRRAALQQPFPMRMPSPRIDTCTRGHGGLFAASRYLKGIMAVPPELRESAIACCFTGAIGLNAGSGFLGGPGDPL
jgi:hypothetical protein